jgi:hypothetical protein
MATLAQKWRLGALLIDGTLKYRGRWSERRLHIFNFDRLTFHFHLDPPPAAASHQLYSKGAILSLSLSHWLAIDVYV